MNKILLMAMLATLAINGVFAKGKKTKTGEAPLEVTANEFFSENFTAQKGILYKITGINLSIGLDDKIYFQGTQWDSLSQVLSNDEKSRIQRATDYETMSKNYIMYVQTNKSKSTLKDLKVIKIENIPTEDDFAKEDRLAEERKAEEVRLAAERKAEQKKIETEQQLVAKKEHAAIYAKILATKQPAKLVEYIYGYRGTELFNENVYLDIARIISNNKNITLTNLPNINNPYNLDKKTIYYANTIQVIQWTGNGTFLAETDTGDYIFIRNVYDISKINDVIQNTYIKYQGTYEYNSVGQGYKVVPEFDLLYNFDGPEM